MPKNKFLIILLLGSLMLNVILGIRLLSKPDEAEQALQNEYPYLSKKIFVEDQNDILINFIPLRTALREYVEMQNGKVGAYFEYLPSGTSIGVNDKQEIKIVSLSKVPLVMSIFKKIERKKMSLGDVLVIEKKHLNQEFGTLWKSGEGTKISVEELIWLTLAESDNTAYNILSDQLTGQEIEEPYKGLDIPLGQEKEGEEVYLLISPKNYSSIFRSLYLSSFLSEEHSNSILDILARTVFNNKIAAGIPENIKVSHKIGVFNKQNVDQDLFTDCGIIYVPDRPYTLCVFVKDTEDQAQKQMSYLSRIVYEYIRIVKTE